MADPTDAQRPTPPQLLIDLTGAPGQVELALHRLRDAFATVRATEPHQVMIEPELVRVHVTAVL
jgi:hypothetical protein